MSATVARPQAAPVETNRWLAGNRWTIVACVVAGALLAVLWSSKLVDSTIGITVADNVLGHDARNDAIVGTAAALLFAFVSGFAGTFTACNIAMVASIGPMSQLELTRGIGRRSVRSLLRPLGLLALGMVTVSAVYGSVGVLLGDHLPQLSAGKVGDFPVRLMQSSVVFGLIGLAMVYLGLGTLGAVPDAFRNRPTVRVLAMGALVGGFLIGRPYPLFNQLFHWAVASGNPLYGAATFVLQSLGNILVVSVVYVGLVLITRGGFPSRLANAPRATAIVTGGLLLVFGVFLLAYWDVRAPARFLGGWFPVMPYNR
jgi:hypothetical protein